MPFAGSADGPRLGFGVLVHDAGCQGGGLSHNLTTNPIEEA